jgi:site-specific DNA recombinase
VLAQIRHKETAIDRYHTAFENGAMDDTTAGNRLNTLRREITQLTACAVELADTVGSQPAPPPPATMERLHAYLASIIAAGTPAELKAAIEALVAEVRITDDGIIPLFCIPGPRTRSRRRRHCNRPVRATGQAVGRLGLEPRTGGL